MKNFSKKSGHAIMNFTFFYEDHPQGSYLLSEIKNNIFKERIFSLQTTGTFNGNFFWNNQFPIKL